MDKIRQDWNIGKNLRNLRKRCGFKQEQVVAKLQLLESPTTRSVYSRYETGELNIRVSDLVHLKQIFQCSYEEIFEGIEEREE